MTGAPPPTEGDVRPTAVPLSARNISVCEACGRGFGRCPGRGRPRKFCEVCVPPGSGRAATRAWRAANPEAVAASNVARRRVPVERKCEECCESFEARRTDARFCSRTCAARSQRRRKSEAQVEATRVRHRRQSRHGNHVRLARLSRLPSDLTPALCSAILAGRTFCPLCRRRMVEGPRGNPRQKQLDHIVPLCVGGSHTRGNVRVICASCNQRRPTDGSDLPASVLASAAGEATVLA
jgi:hypothetical protein